MKTSPLLLLSLCLGLGGCAATSSPPAVRENPVTLVRAHEVTDAEYEFRGDVSTVDMDYDQALTRAMGYAARLGATVLVVEPSSGRSIRGMQFRLRGKAYRKRL